MFDAYDYYNDDYKRWYEDEHIERYEPEDEEDDDNEDLDDDAASFEYECCGRCMKCLGLSEKDFY
jgi:hypothetical protein